MSFVPYHRHVEDEEVNVRVILKCFLGKYITVPWASFKRLDLGLLATLVIRAVETPASAARVLKLSTSFENALISIYSGNIVKITRWYGIYFIYYMFKGTL
jgi:hypothetical protein